MSSSYGYAYLPASTGRSPSFLSSTAVSLASTMTANGPVTRSRTGLFLSYRNTVSRTPTGSTFASTEAARRIRKGKGRARDDDDDEDGDEERSGLLGNGVGHEVIHMNTLPPQWLDEADKVDGILDRIKPKLNQLERLHAKHILPGFADKTAEEREIAALTTDVTRELRRCQHVIAKIAHIAKNMPFSTTSKEDRIMIQNVQTALATKTQDISTIFRKKQSNYLKQLRGYDVKKQDILAGSGVVPAKDEYAAVDDDVQLSKDTLASSSIGIQSHVQEQTTGLSMQAIMQRDREITSIAESITDLAGLFKDLSTLVIDQGTLLDRIDYNVEQMAADMEAAVKELQTATTYQRRSGKRQAICLLILLIVGAIIVLVYKPKSTSVPIDLSAPPSGSVVAAPSVLADTAAAWKHFPPDIVKSSG